ncbi:MAG TPA: hypothetical protein PKX17_03460 [Candidatus Methanomethylicus sp.]|nr:hypothetical protein [Candidatus Methanomethylicus sp.]
MDIIIWMGLWAVGFLIGAICIYALLKRRHSGWFALPQNSKLVLTVDGSNIGHFWEPGRTLPNKQAELAVCGGGMISLEEGSAIFLPQMGVKLFLHYADHFRTVKAKHAAAFSFFKGKDVMAQVLGDEKEGKAMESTERQADNQPEMGVVFDLRDIRHWVKNITPSMMLEGAIAAGMKFSGIKELILESDEGNKINTKLLVILMIAGAGIFALYYLFGR